MSSYSGVETAEQWSSPEDASVGCLLSSLKASHGGKGKNQPNGPSSVALAHNTQVDSLRSFKEFTERGRPAEEGKPHALTEDLLQWQVLGRPVYRMPSFPIEKKLL